MGVASAVGATVGETSVAVGMAVGTGALVSVGSGVGTGAGEHAAATGTVAASAIAMIVLFALKRLAPLEANWIVFVRSLCGFARSSIICAYHFRATLAAFVLRW